MSLLAAHRAVPVLLAACLAGGRLAAQDTTAVPVPDTTAAAPDSVHLPADTARAPAVAPAVTPAPVTAQAADTLPLMRRPISPGGALIRSLVIPGWGQARMGRSLVAGFFLVVEGAALGMALKANSELNYMRAINSPTVTAKTQEREDWLVIVGVNHLLAGIEAYVSAYLWDFPGDLHYRPTANGSALTVSMPVRLP